MLSQLFFKNVWKHLLDLPLLCFHSISRFLTSSCIPTLHPLNTHTRNNTCSHPLKHAGMPSCMHACTHKATCLWTVTDSFHTHSAAPDNNCAHPHAETIVVRWRDNGACLSSAWAPPCLPVSVGVKRIQLQPDAERERERQREQWPHRQTRAFVSPVRPPEHNPTCKVCALRNRGELCAQAVVR